MNICPFMVSTKPASNCRKCDSDKIDRLDDIHYKDEQS
jgi:hypothetical protein